MAGDPDGSLRELLRDHLEVHPAGLHATVLYLYHHFVLGKIPSLEG